MSTTVSGGGSRRSSLRQPRQTALLASLRAFRDGDFSVRLPANLTGIDGEIAQALNDCIDRGARMAEEFAQISEVVGREGVIGKRVSIPESTGAWRDCVESVNQLIGDLAYPMSEA